MSENGNPISIADRAADGISVDLIWSHAEDGDTYEVVVDDSRSGEHKVLRINGPPEDLGKIALFAFKHPYAYEEHGYIPDKEAREQQAA